MNRASPSDQQAIIRATELTANNLRRLMTQTVKPNDSASHISVPEREELIEQIAQVLPAGNVVNFVMGGILSARGREISPAESRVHLNSLFKGLSILQKNTFYGMVYAGPASILAGYNMLLKLAGVNELGEGVWQFYVEFGLREDTARHQSETLGFHQALGRLSPRATEAECLTVWILAAMWLLRDYEHLLAAVWEDKTRLTAMQEKTDLQNLHRTWQSLTPYSLPAGQHDPGLVAYRRQRFHAFCETQLGHVGQAQREAFLRYWNDPEHEQQRRQRREAYQNQLSIHACLEPTEYAEKRVPLSKKDLHIAVIYQHRYYLLNLLDPASPTAPALAYQHARSILKSTGDAAELDLQLIKVPRAEQSELRAKLEPVQREALEMLRTAPVIINWDAAGSRQQPLSRIREQQRGVGDHALTLFRTDSSMVFDFSHIFFDGPWAMAVAEMMTGEAIRRLSLRPQMHSTLPDAPPARALNLKRSALLGSTGRRYSRHITYVSAEAHIPLAPLNELRTLLYSATKPRLHLMVNDLLVMYRTMFNQVYEMSDVLRSALEKLGRENDGKPLAAAVLEDYHTRREINPSLFIPIDASQFNPADRIFPSIFRSPFLDLYATHRHTFNLLTTANRKHFGRQQAQREFQQACAHYLGMVRAFAEVMDKYREIAIEGQSMSTKAIRLIAGLPGAMQKLFDEMPDHFTFMNEALKGEEVFSNVGQVTVGSSLARFSSAKDDNDRKTLVWGIMTDNENSLHVTLRDFRPSVMTLALMGRAAIAEAVTQDFLNAYLRGLSAFTVELKAIVRAAKS